jgi:hypothetical protein
MKTYKCGDKFRVVITLDATLETDDGFKPTKDQLVGLIFHDKSYGLKSIISGQIREDSADKETQITWDIMEVAIRPPKP